MANLYALKPWYTRRLKLFLDFAVRHNVSPDVFTAIGILGGLIAIVGFLYFPPLVIVGVAVRLGGANLDGAVARARNVSRPFGFVLNEIGDRVGDMLLFVGLALALPDQAVWVMVVAILSSLPTLVSVSGAAVQVPRINGGPFGKTERCLFFCVLAFLTSLPLVVGIALAIMGAGAVLTTLTRANRVRHHLASGVTP